MNPATIPGVELDFDHGMIRLGSRRYPACIELWHRGWLASCDGVCATCEPFPDQCPVGGNSVVGDVDWSEQWDVVIPLENEVRIWVGLTRHKNHGVDLGLRLHVALHGNGRHPDAAVMADERTGLIWAGVRGRQIIQGCHLSDGQSFWNDCDPEWAAELIDRLAKMARPSPIPGTIPSGLCSISDPRVRGGSYGPC